MQMLRDFSKGRKINLVGCVVALGSCAFSAYTGNIAAAIWAMNASILFLGSFLDSITINNYKLLVRLLGRGRV